MVITLPNMTKLGLILPTGVHWPPLVPVFPMATLSLGVQKTRSLVMVYLPRRRADLTVCCTFHLQGRVNKSSIDTLSV